MSSDFSMYAGDDKTIEVSVTDKNGDAVDITSATIEWRAAKSHNKTAAVTKTTSSGISITNGAGGVFQITLTDSDTEDLVGSYYHEAQVTFSSGLIATVLTGLMNVNAVLITAAT